MLLQRVNRKNADNIFTIVQNVEGATITTGRPVAYAGVAASCDGIQAVIANAAADFPGFIGIATQDIANNDYGLVQIFGFVNSIYLSNVGSSVTINANDPLVPGPAGMFSAAPTYANAGFKFALAQNVPVAVSAAAYCSGLIKML